MASMGSMAGGGTGGLGPMYGQIADLGTTVASYPTYAQAQRAMDFLSDNRFPVEQASIVGTHLSLVENVLGRMTTGKSALTGAMTGGWFGLFIGLMFGLFTRRNWFEVVFVGLAIGAVWGAIFGAIAHAATRGVRDFVSTRSLAAGTYELKVKDPYVEQARIMLANLPLS
jgi:ascorbate-specific PTS system EIIC-type component UlaA